MSMHSDNSTAGWLAGAVKNHPEGLLLLAAGCALLMRSASDRVPAIRTLANTAETTCRIPAQDRGAERSEKAFPRPRKAQASTLRMSAEAWPRPRAAMRLQFLIMPRMSHAVPRSRRDVSLNRRKAPCRKRLLALCRSSLWR